MEKDGWMEFSDRFTKSLAATLYQYEDAPITLDDELIKAYLEERVENGESICNALCGHYERLSDWNFWKDTFASGYPYEEGYYAGKDNSYLCAIFMLLFVVEKMLNEHGLYELKILYDIGMDVSLINSFISSAIMDYDFEEKGELDFNSNYFPNSMVPSYIFTIHRTESALHMIEKERDLLYPLFSEELMTVRERVDRNVIVTGISFMQIQAILLLMERSNLYPMYIKKVAKDLLFIFKEILANTRIKRIEIDAAICGGMVRNGVKKTTGIKIFFALENFDCYCLRIDFPHEGVDYLHINLHEPMRKTAYPLRPGQYSAFSKKHGDFSNFFFAFGNLYWFRNNFVAKVNDLARFASENEMEQEEKLCRDLLEVFSKQEHYHIADHDISKENMMEFVAEFGSALTHCQIKGVSYSDTAVENINEELEKIKLADILSDALVKYQRYRLDERVFGDACEKKIADLKALLLKCLLEHFPSEAAVIGTKEELEELQLEDIFLFVEDVCDLKK